MFKAVHPNVLACQECIDTWNQEPSKYGDSRLELDAYDTHKTEHKVKYTRLEILEMIGTRESIESFKMTSG